MGVSDRGHPERSEGSELSSKPRRSFAALRMIDAAKSRFSQRVLVILGLFEENARTPLDIKDNHDINFHQRVLRRSIEGLMRGLSRIEGFRAAGSWRACVSPEVGRPTKFSEARRCWRLVGQ